MTNKDRMQKNIDEFTEWQENQYNPGHWIGGITPNNLLSPRRPKVVGVVLILIALLMLLLFIFVLSNYMNERQTLISMEHVYYIAQLVLLGGFALLLLIGGMMKVMRKNGGKKK